MSTSPRRRRGGPRRPAGRNGGGKGPPPASTGAEATYLHALRANEAPLRVHLCDGRVVEGRVEYFDRDMIKILRAEGPHLFVRKTDIRYVEEDAKPS